MKRRIFSGADTGTCFPVLPCFFQYMAIPGKYFPLKEEIRGKCQIVSILRQEVGKFFQERVIVVMVLLKG